MKNLLNGYLVALALAAAVGLPAAAQQPELRAGVSVEMPITTSAVPMPDADTRDSLIVAVTRDGNVYLGITPVSPAGLAEEVKKALSAGARKKLYIKGDARTPHANIAKVLDAVRKAGVEAPNLLTAQRDTPEPAYPVPPKGLEVLVGLSPPPASESIVVQALEAGERTTLSIDREPIPSDRLESALRQLFQNRRPKLIVLKADQRLPFQDVVRLIDSCRAAGAKVFLASAGS